MRIAFVNPPVKKVLEPRYDTPDFTRLGLACLASSLRAAMPITPLLLDAKFERLSFSQTEARLRAFEPDVVALTAFTNEIKAASEVASRIKAWRPRTITVIGGTHCTALPRPTLEEFSCFDVGVVGEGEVTFTELCQALASGDDLGEIPGLVWRNGSEVVVNVSRARTNELDSFPLPAWDLLPSSVEYLVMTARGCPYTCPFCQNPNGRLVRKRSVEKVVEELLWIAERPEARRILFCDEIFSIDMERTHRLLDKMIEAGIGGRFRWVAQTHVNCVDQELFRKMKAAGCERIGLGIETGDEELARALGKSISIEKARWARDLARKAGLPVEAYFIFGHPNETWQTALRTIEFACELNPDLPIFGIMVPYPGTEVARLAYRGEGGYRIISTDWDDYNKQIGGALEFEHLPRHKLERLQALAYIKVFTYNRRWVDLARFVWNYRREGLTLGLKLLGSPWRRKQKSIKTEPVFRVEKPSGKPSEASGAVKASNKDIIPTARLE